jgi:putative phosphoesterase
MTNVLLIADTHLGPGLGGRLIGRIGAELAHADVVFHAGDITDGSVLDALAAHVPVHAVEGNNDHGLALPDRLTVDVDGCSIAMVHDSGAASGRAARLRRWFPDADVVVFGHSHLPWHETDVRAADGHVQHHVNPGSAMLRRRAPTCTVARLEVHAGAVTSVRHVPVG